MNSLGHSCFDDHSAIAETVRKNKERFKKAVKVFRNPLGHPRAGDGGMFFFK